MTRILLGTRPAHFSQITSDDSFVQKKYIYITSVDGHFVLTLKLFSHFEVVQKSHLHFGPTVLAATFPQKERGGVQPHTPTRFCVSFQAPSPRIDGEMNLCAEELLWRAWVLFLLLQDVVEDCCQTCFLHPVLLGGIFSRAGEAWEGLRGKN